MKKLIVAVMCLALMAATAMPSLAYGRHRHYRSRAAYYTTYGGQQRAYYSYEPRRSFWQKHRDKLTLAGGTAGGALIGAAVGGHRGAGIGALAGAGSSALYTYKLRKRHTYRRY
jgi:hypothetical protein